MCGTLSKQKSQRSRCLTPSVEPEADGEAGTKLCRAIAMVSVGGRVKCLHVMPPPPRYEKHVAGQQHAVKVPQSPVVGELLQVGLLNIHLQCMETVSWEISCMTATISHFTLYVVYLVLPQLTSDQIVTCKARGSGPGRAAPT